MRFASALSVLTAISHQMLIQRKSPPSHLAHAVDNDKCLRIDLLHTVVQVAHFPVREHTENCLLVQLLESSLDWQEGGPPVQILLDNLINPFILPADDQHLH